MAYVNMIKTQKRESKTTPWFQKENTRPEQKATFCFLLFHRSSSRRNKKVIVAFFAKKSLRVCLSTNCV